MKLSDLEPKLERARNGVVHRGGVFERQSGGGRLRRLTRGALLVRNDETAQIQTRWNAFGYIKTRLFAAQKTDERYILFPYS